MDQAQTQLARAVEVLRLLLGADAAKRAVVVAILRPDRDRHITPEGARVEVLATEDPAKIPGAELIKTGVAVRLDVIVMPAAKKIRQRKLGLAVLRIGR